MHLFEPFSLYFNQSNVKYLGAFDSPTNVHTGITWARDLGCALAILAPDLRFDCLSLVSAVADPQLKSSSNVFPSIEHG